MILAFDFWDEIFKCYLIHISVTMLSSADDIDTNNNAAFESVD